MKAKVSTTGSITEVELLSESKDDGEVLAKIFDALGKDILSVNHHLADVAESSSIVIRTKK